MPTPFQPPADPRWPAAAPEQAGFASDIDRKLAAGIESGLLRDLHAVLVARAGKLVMEQYYEGPDENWGDSIGHISFGPDTLHDLRSVTKSVVSLLYGIALDRGLVPPLDAPLLAQFPEYTDLAADPQRAGITIQHALTMNLGMEWDENRPYTDPLNSEVAMEYAPDRYRFILERPIVAEPGTRWIYSGGSVALIGALVARGTGKSVPDFAREALFEPLGITRFEWNAGPDGVISAASGLRLVARDLLQIGALIIGNGELDGRRIVSRTWVEESLVPATETSDGLGYGRLWFIGNAPVPALSGNRKWVGGFGNGGQRLWLMPDADLVCVTYAGTYNQPDSWVTPMRVWREIVLANFVAA